MTRFRAYRFTVVLVIILVFLWNRHVFGVTNLEKNLLIADEQIKAEDNRTATEGRSIISSSRSKQPIKETSNETFGILSKLTTGVNGTTIAHFSNENTDKINIKIPFPVFVASLYKSGTTTIHDYFQCGGQRSTHTKLKYCIRGNILGGKDPFKGCRGSGKVDILTDNDVLHPPDCFHPSVDGLEAIYAFHPNSTILLAVRDSVAWIDSVERFRFPKWGLLQALQECRNLFPDQAERIGNRTLTKDEVRQFYEWQVEHVRRFAKGHPSMTYIEIQLESPQNGRILEEKVGIPSRCWGHSNVNKIFPAQSNHTLQTD